MTVKRPEFHPTHGCPVWWHHHGQKVHLIQGRAGQIELANGRVATLTIAPHEQDKWRVSWQLVHWAGGDRSEGQRIFTSQQLRSAFDLSCNPEKEWFGDWLIQRYGGTIAAQQLFLRYDRFLNIPGPGTGHDGTPEISIEINKAIKDAVFQIIRLRFLPEFP